MHQTLEREMISGTAWKQMLPFNQCQGVIPQNALFCSQLLKFKSLT